MNQQLITLNSSNIPAYQHYYVVSENVSSISPRAFEGSRETLTDIDFESPYLKEIGEYAFDQCRFIEVVDLRNCSSLISIGVGAFQRCYYLHTVYINEQLQYINYHAFYLCYSLENMVIPINSSLQIMKEHSIAESKMKYFYIPKNLYEVGLGNAWFIEKVDVHPENHIFAFNNSCLMNYNQEIVFYCFNTDPNAVIHIPETVFGIESYSFILIQGKKVIFPKILTWMHQFAFHRCQIQYYDFSNVVSISEIPHNAFELSKIKSLNLSKVSNLEINHRAFLSCYNLETVTISPSCIYIGQDSFKFCTKLTKINIPPDSKLQRIVNFAFAFTNIKEFEISLCIQFIGINVFEGVPNVVIKCDPNNLYFTIKDGVLFFDKSSILIWYPPYLRNETYKIPSHATTLRSYCFYKAFYLKELIFPVQLTKILQHAICCTNITEIKLPPLVSSVEMYAFANNQMLKTVDFGETIKFIPKFVLSDCINLKYIYIPPSVTYVRQKAFENCRSLQCVSCGKHLVNLLSQQIPLRIIRVDGRCSFNDDEIIVI